MKCKAASLALVLLAVLCARAQEKPAPEKETGENTPPVALTVQVVFSEFEGERKISSLPYTIPVNATARERGSRPARVRMGIRVPITSGENAFQYMEVGTNIDCQAHQLAGGRFELDLNVERTSVYSAAEKKPVEWTPNEPMAIAAQPIVRHYKAEMVLMIRDGQTIQRAVATDPLSGRVVKLDVTLNVVK